MSIVVKTPFRSSGLETDPVVYGLRPDELRQGIFQLYNDKSILITGSRGIGKSSLGYQLQKIMQGDDTILRRCVIDIKMPKYLTISYICTPDDTLETIVLGIINSLETQTEECKEKFGIRMKDIDLSFFGMIKTKIEVEAKKEKKDIALVDVLVETIHKFTQIYVDPHINISLDELDQLNEKYNIAHFIKVVLEKLDRRGDDFLSFILVGQSSLFNTLYKSQPAFFRLVKHISLYPLDAEYARDVLYACLQRSEVPTRVGEKCEDLFLKLTCGYPYNIQLLGHETYISMLEKYDKRPKEFSMTMDDLLAGLKNVIVSEGTRYAMLFDNLEPYEKNCILMLANASLDECPYVFSLSSIEEGVSIPNEKDRKEVAAKVIDSLLEKQIIQEVDDKITNEKIYSFQEEIFRVYLNDRMYNKKRLGFND